jgi:hypothetical protein
MATYVCPKGHASHDGDYCDECGAAIAGVSQAAMGTGTANAPSTTAASGSTAAAPTGAVCPECQSPQAGRFCEVCGYDFIMAKIGGVGAAPTVPPEPSEPAVPSPAATPDETLPSAAVAGSSTSDAASAATASGWRLTVRSDADYHARMDAQREPDTEAIPFPAFCPERRFALSGTQALIGRRSRSRGIEPEIDLSGPPGDPAVSHAHALLVTQPDGTWAVVDLESANGTYVNDGVDPIESNAPIALADGDRVHVGSWTTITVQRT